MAENGLNNFTVYKSSAGSGKTFTLVKEYLKLAFKNKNDLKKSYKGILAITFTNKAAAEMKWRIINALKEISTENSPSDLTLILAKELNVSNEELCQRAKIVLKEILHHYSDFSISTIDSFTHRIIKTFALDLKLPFNFKIETDVISVFNEVTSLLINNLGKDVLITNYLVEFSLKQVDENKKWDPESILIDFIKKIYQEGDKELVTKLSHYTISDFNEIKNTLHQWIKNYFTFLKTNGETALHLIKKNQLTVNDFYYGKSGIYNFFVKISKANKTTTKQDLFGANVKTTLNEDKWEGSKISVESKVSLLKLKPKLQEIVSNVQNFLDENESTFFLYNILSVNIYAIGLINELTKLVETYKTDENILFISEFNERISEVVTQEPTPFIFERLGERYHNFLIDEFQDTSILQWQNILPLVDNSLGNGNKNLIVGDGKQSIYRWRNANVEQFVSLPKISNSENNKLLKEREKSLVRNFDEKFLDTNYRSNGNIVNFNNDFFNFLSNIILIDNQKAIYKNQEQKFKDEGVGYVSIDFPDANKNNNNDVNKEYTLKYIKQALLDGYLYSDICIIIRKNKNGNEIANFLIQNNIPVVSSESLLLSKAKEIELIISFFKYLSNQKDNVAAATVINFCYVNNICSEEQYVLSLREITHNKQSNLFNVLNSFKLNINQDKIFGSNLFDISLEIISVFKINQSNSQYVRFFLDTILNYLQNSTSNIHLFLEWWERNSNSASVIIPEGINAVNIMTIHSSKGLEFPVVITPHLNWEIEPKQQSQLWIELNEPEINLPVALINTSKMVEQTQFAPIVIHEKQQQILDSLNLMYVDFTRAVNRLHIISTEPNSIGSKNVHYWLKIYVSQKPKFNELEQKYEFGELVQKQKNNKHKTGLEQLPHIHLSFNTNNNAIKIKESLLFNYGEEHNKAREYGVLIHSILSQINYISDLAEVIKQSIFRGDISDEEAIEIEKILFEILNNNLLKPYFENSVSVKNEIEILTKNGKVLRPDRVVVKGDEAIVIDYKTGKKHTEKYHQQMLEYKDALIELGFVKVKMLLLYIFENQIEEVF
jgi:ATP-dependent exoDNAse (exonuclease V) beta subunit